MNEIKIFNNPLFGEVRVFIVNNEPWFVGKDVALLLGYAKPENALSTHVDDEDKTITLIQGTGSNYKSNTTIINESGMYSLVFGSRLKTAKEFKRWVTSDVLPSIRKTGGYLATKQDDTPELIMARALQVAQMTIDKHNARIIKLEAENAEKCKAIEQAEEQVIQLSDTVASMKPKVDYCDIILQSKETVATTQIAQDYGMTAKAFNILLRNFGIQHKVAGQWILYAPYLPLGYVQSESIPITHTDGRKTTKLFSKWTQKGRLFLYEELKKNNVLPLIERKEEVA